MSADEIQRKGWRQGSVVPEALARQLITGSSLEDKMNLQDDILIVISHDCDVCSKSFEKEPNVELLLAKAITQDSLNPNVFYAKSPRVVQFEADHGANKAFYECSINDRIFAVRQSLMEYFPDSSKTISSELCALLRRWLSNRYARSALPDEFNKRVTDRGKSKIKAALSSAAHLITGIYIHTSWNELAASDNYKLLMIATMKTNDYDVVSKREAAEKALARVASALGACPGIEMLDHAIRPHSEFSLDDITSMRRYDYDDLSLRDSPPQDLPPHI